MLVMNYSYLVSKLYLNYKIFSILLGFNNTCVNKNHEFMLLDANFFKKKQFLL